MFLIGGASGVGKTTLGMALAKRLRIKSLTIDDLVTAVIAVTTPETHPGIHALRRVPHLDYYTNSSVAQLKADATLRHQATWPMVASLIRKYVNSNASLHNASFSGANLRGTDLIEDKYRFVWQVINEKPLQQDLRGKDLRYVHFEKVDLSDMDLSDADFTGSYLSNINFRGSKLNGTRLVNLSSFSWFINLHNSKIDSRTQMDNTLQLVWQIVNEGVPAKNLKKADLKWTCLQGSNLANANLSDSKLHRAKLMGANIVGQNAVLSIRARQRLALRFSFIVVRHSACCLSQKFSRNLWEVGRGKCPSSTI